MHRLDDIEFNLEDFPKHPEIQEAMHKKAFDELVQRALPGSIAYVVLYLWMLYATNLLQQSPYLTLSAGVVMILASLLRALLAFQGKNSRRFFQHERMIFICCTLLAGLIWSFLGLSVFMLADSGMRLNHDILLMAILLFAIVAGGMNVLSIIPSLWKAFVFILLLPLIIGLLFVGTQTAIALAILVFFGLLFTLDVGRRIHADYWRHLESESQLQYQTEALEKARDVALDAARSKSFFLANMSHEIRTPMHGVLGMANLLLSTPLSHKQHSFAHAIKRSGDALLLIINDILDFSKIEAGKLELDRKAFDLRKMIEDVADLLREQAFEKNIELITQLPANLPQKLLADGGRLQQIMLNLAGNAVKFTQVGEVVMAIKEISRDDHKIRLAFSVTDSGIGIALEKQRHIFQAFTQSDTSTTRQFGGTGLGLAISNQLVSMMDSEIHLQSELGKGSVFGFELELGIDETSIEHGLLTYSLKGTRMLVVDDNLTNCKILHDQLQSWGINNRILQKPQHVLTELKKASADHHPYDVIVLDMHMPGMDGIELTRAIRADTQLAQLSVIMMTSGSMDEEQAEAASAGIDAYLCKPVRQSLLYQSLCSALQPHVGTSNVKKALPDKTYIDRINANLLLAEDNEVNQTIAKIMLEELGCKVHIVSDGQQAVDAFCKGDIDIILMDCQMPVLDGYEASQKIRSIEMQAGEPSVDDKHIPIVALTAHAILGDREKCLNAGMDDYLTKPFNREQLQDILCMHLPEYWQSDADTTDQSVSQSLEGSKQLDAKTISLLPGGDAMRQKVMTMFLQSMANLLADMRAGIHQDDNNTVMRAAHTLKSSSAMVGALQLSELCKQIEHISSKNDCAGLECMLQEARNISQRVEHEIRAYYLDEGGAA